MSVTLSEQDKLTLRTAAWGAVSLMSAAGAAGSAHRVGTEGSIALTSATGLVGHVLAKAPKGLRGTSVAALADQVLPALTASMSLLRQQAPAEADNFRRTVLVAVEAATMPQQGAPSPTLTEMARKITEALDAASAAPDRPELQKIIQEMVDSGFVGVTLRVRDQRGEWVGSAGSGQLGGTEQPPVDGHFRIGSNTKTFTATVVLQLVAQGRIGLDAPVAGYLPEFGLDERITVRMLLQHTSGVFNFTGDYYPEYVPGVVYQGREWVEGRFRTYRPEELVRLALSKPARFEPGTDWSYSNTNYVLARLLVEKVTGRSLGEEMRRLILRPLGLSGTVVPDTSTDVPTPHAHAYYRYEEDGQEQVVDVTRQNPSWISTGGDMISTTADLATFISALLGGRLLPGELLAEMCTPEAKAGYGLGVFVQDVPGGGKVITHNGGITGHAGLMYSTPDGGRTLTASLNYVDDAALSMGEAFQKGTQRLVQEVFGGK
ncbi:serine hydrolase domain-containing protein [Nonomuraea sp. SYSU D8015]|uniref:serine hydrolase domain-containing protein n=1 Tax=Nonomuraea sp. SYSU D8015 TaxID=2593644 RepID=UPI001CB6DBA9|nr:serine hydrolase domain-containing protein [Nonomuraea sp. SYSU D8015]